MNERIWQLQGQAKVLAEEIVSQRKYDDYMEYKQSLMDHTMNKFAELIVEECVDKIETYRIPVGNSAAGELACEWTYDALKEIRDDIKEHFGVDN